MSTARVRNGDATAANAKRRGCGAAMETRGVGAIARTESTPGSPAVAPSQSRAAPSSGLPMSCGAARRSVTGQSGHGQGRAEACAPQQQCTVEASPVARATPLVSPTTTSTSRQTSTRRARRTI